MKTILKKACCYLIGLLLITVGINLSKMSALGISPASSVPRVCELIWGFTLGKTTIIIYCLLVLFQLVLLRKNFKIQNALGVLVAIVFGYMVDFTGTDPEAFGHLMLNFPRPGNYPMRVVYMLLSILVIGFGVFLYLRPKFVPMPPEGLAGAISEVTGKAFGDCKTLVDTSLVVIAVILQILFLGGISSFFGENTAIREGTLIIALFVGQAVKFFAKRLGKSVDGWLEK